MRRAGLLAALVRAWQRSGADGGADFGAAAVERDIAYGSRPEQRLDVYRPPHADGAAVIFVVHGGGWRLGDKAGPRVVANKVSHWVGQGCVLVSVNYRLMPEAPPLEQADDVALALAHAQGRAADWGADPARFAVVGHSSGAHLAALLAADPALATRHGARPWLATVAIDSAALDVEALMTRPHAGLYDIAFGADPQRWREASPIHRLQGPPAAPMLLVCSTLRGDSCPPAQAFAARAQSLGGRLTVLPVDLSHLQTNEQLGVPGEYTAAVDAFLRSVGVP